MGKLIPVTLHLPDQRGVEISPFGRGNVKIGPSVYTYSRVAGRGTFLGTCPGSTDECEAICYAKRIQGPVLEQYVKNSQTADVPPIPRECRLLRIHVSGDFDSPEYVYNWLDRLEARPDVTAWTYTRSWRVPSILPALEDLRKLPNIQVFASMDTSTEELPPPGWRIAWIEGDERLIPTRSPHHFVTGYDDEGWVGYVCPEETGRKENCEKCRYCFDGKKHDVVFLRH